MKYLDDFLEYLIVIKKHEDNTINNYRIDIVDFLGFVDNNIDISKEDVSEYLKYLYSQNYYFLFDYY